MMPIPRLIPSPDGRWRVVESEIEVEYGLIVKLGRIATREEIDRYRFGDTAEPKS